MWISKMVSFGILTCHSHTFSATVEFQLVLQRNMFFRKISRKIWFRHVGNVGNFRFPHRLFHALFFGFWHHSRRSSWTDRPCPLLRLHHHFPAWSHVTARYFKNYEGCNYCYPMQTLGAKTVAFTLTELKVHAGLGFYSNHCHPPSKRYLTASWPTKEMWKCFKSRIFLKN
jgi:hypothetical protein